MQRVQQLKKLGRRAQQGFTLIELMIVVAIIGILAAIAIPQYQKYTAKAKYTEVIQATAPFKVAVEQCYQAGNPLTTANGTNGCDTAGANGIPAAATAAGNVSSVAVSAGGVITAIAATNTSLAGETYILTPTANAAGAANALSWAIGGTCGAKALC